MLIVVLFFFVGKGEESTRDHFFSRYKTIYLEGFSGERAIEKIKLLVDGKLDGGAEYGTYHLVKTEMLESYYDTVDRKERKSYDTRACCQCLGIIRRPRRSCDVARWNTSRTGFDGVSEQEPVRKDCRKW